MAVGDAKVFPGFLTPVLTQLFFPKPPTTFLTCFCRSERRKYAGKKSLLNRGSNSQSLGHESDTLTTEPPGRGINPPLNIARVGDSNQSPPVLKSCTLPTVLRGLCRPFENIVGNGENACYQHFLLFSQSFLNIKDKIVIWAAAMYISFDDLKFFNFWIMILNFCCLIKK